MQGLIIGMLIGFMLGGLYLFIFFRGYSSHRPKNLPSEYNGYWIPPYRWQIRLYRLIGRQAPDRWIEVPPARK